MNYLSRIKNISNIMNLAGSFPLPEGVPQIGEDRAVYQNDTVKVVSAYIPQAQGITQRVDTVENVSPGPICVRTALSRFCFNGGEYQVYTQYSQWTEESRGAWQQLHTSIGGRNSDVRTNSTAAPFFALFNEQTGRGMAFHILADSMWQFEVRKHFVSGSSKHIRVEMGMDNTNLAITLQPGEVLTLPRILYYEFTNKVDLDAYRLHRYCKRLYRPKAFPAVYNTWMSSFDRVSLEGLTQQLMEAKALGLEYFVMDTGWFGPPGAWFGSVGDWEETQDAGLMGQMKILADRVREQGLKFGLWFEIERASVNSKAANANPQHYIFQNKNAFVDFGNPEACDYVLDVLAKHIRHYGIEYIKFDFNAPLIYDNDQAALRKYMEGCRAFVRQLGEEFPQVYLENCASGGLRMSLSSLEGFDSFWISDNHSLYTQLEIFKNTLLRMPSRALETWISIRSIEKFDPVYDGDCAEKIIMSGDASWGNLEVVPESFLYASAVGGPVGISCDLTRLSEHTKQKLKDFIADFKEDRQFWLDSECHILCDTPKMLILQFCDENYDRLKLCVYAKNPDQNAVTVYPICTPGTVYTHSEGVEYSAQALIEEGLEIPVSGICGVQFELKKN